MWGKDPPEQSFPRKNKKVLRGKKSPKRKKTKVGIRWVFGEKRKKGGAPSPPQRFKKRVLPGGNNKGFGNNPAPPQGEFCISEKNPPGPVVFGPKKKTLGADVVPARPSSNYLGARSSPVPPRDKILGPFGVRPPQFVKRGVRASWIEKNARGKGKNSSGIIFIPYPCPGAPRGWKNYFGGRKGLWPFP